MENDCEGCLTFPMCKNKYVIKTNKNKIYMSMDIFWNCSILLNFYNKRKPRGVKGEGSMSNIIQKVFETTEGFV